MFHLQPHCQAVRRDASPEGKSDVNPALSRLPSGEWKRSSRPAPLQVNLPGLKEQQRHSTLGSLKNCYRKWSAMPDSATVAGNALTTTTTTMCFLDFYYCKTRFYRVFREPDKFVKISGRENLNTVAFQYSRKQKRQNYGVQNNYINSNTKIKGSTVL